MILTLADDLTIEHIDSIKQQLQQGLADADQLTVDLTGAEVVDAAFLQLLCAAQAEAHRLQKLLKLRLADDPDSPFHRACRSLGLERICPA